MILERLKREACAGDGDALTALVRQMRRQGEGCEAVINGLLDRQPHLLPEIARREPTLAGLICYRAIQARHPWQLATPQGHRHGWWYSDAPSPPWDVLRRGYRSYDRSIRLLMAVSVDKHCSDWIDACLNLTAQDLAIWALDVASLCGDDTANASILRQARELVRGGKPTAGLPMRNEVPWHQLSFIALRMAWRIQDDYLSTLEVHDFIRELRILCLTEAGVDGVAAIMHLVKIGCLGCTEGIESTGVVS